MQSATYCVAKLTTVWLNIRHFHGYRNIVMATGTLSQLDEEQLRLEAELESV